MYKSQERHQERIAEAEKVAEDAKSAKAASEISCKEVCYIDSPSYRLGVGGNVSNKLLPRVGGDNNDKGKAYMSVWHVAVGEIISNY